MTSLFERPLHHTLTPLQSLGLSFAASISRVAAFALHVTTSAPLVVASALPFAASTSKRRRLRLRASPPPPLRASASAHPTLNPSLCLSAPNPSAATHAPPFTIPLLRFLPLRSWTTSKG
ncbi:hypothetical protein Fmac_032644 [Flemingia macrophylla]|uniref:Uncharacterized protein n=1 Tax=Flemingia macrophylla TaxID=520843 RepID=A0ABD1L5X4_9FABA